MANLSEELLRAASVMHWFGKFEVANAITLLARLLRAKGIDNNAEFGAWVEETERRDSVPRSNER